MIVCDASAAIAALLRPGPAREYLANDEAHAPYLIDWEVISGIRRQVLANTLRVSHGRDVLRAWRQITINRYPARGMADRVWELHTVLTPYDAAYIALAEALDCPVVTADGPLAGAPGIRCEVLVVPR